MNDNKEVEIISVKAIDASNVPILTASGRKIVYINDQTQFVECLGFAYGGKSFYVPKDMLARNVKGPERRFSDRDW
jgi:hypothetical protein